MDRRKFLQSVATAGGVASVTATAGCLGVFGESGPDETVLDPPEQDLSEAVYPSYGDEMPEFTVPDPIAGKEISISELKGNRAMLYTSFYTNCPDGVCPALILRLRRAQEVTAEQGYDGGEFLALTFDPERDTQETIREYAAEQGVDVAADNWHFLRPESYEAAQDILKEKFGLVIEKQPAEQYDNLEYQFPHVGLILLVNKRGIVERAYPNPTVDIERVTDDFAQVVTA